MASDLSSGCAEAIEILDGKEEGEISLEDVSSSEESHPTYVYKNRITQCSTCMSTQFCASWCTAPTRQHNKGYNSRDAVQGKENRRHLKESTSLGNKYSISTLQEKNDDLIPISSDSDMEIVSLMDKPNKLLLHNISKARKKKKRKKRSLGPSLKVDTVVSGPSVDLSMVERWDSINAVSKESNISRSHRKDASPLRRTNRPRYSLRYRSPNRGRSPHKRSRTPNLRSRSPLRPSPRRGRSPKRNLHDSRKISRYDTSKAVRDADIYNIAKLLKKTKHADTALLEMTFKKNKERASSLKEKLSHMLKKVSDNNANTTNFSKEVVSTEVNNQDPDDDDDIAVLRQKALETKQNKSNKIQEDSKNINVQESTMKDAQVNEKIEPDIEDLELRMEALRSAIVKKYQNKTKKSLKTGTVKKRMDRSESPFTQSFLDSIPIPDDAEIDYMSPCTPPSLVENTQTEDMDLDTDVEREKEKLPYSPTDKITSSVPIDTDLLGLKPSDVSFIPLNEANNVQTTNTVEYNKEEQILQNNRYQNSPIQATDSYSTTNQHNETLSENAPYSPSDPIETPKSDFSVEKPSISCIPISKLLFNDSDDKTLEYTVTNHSESINYNDEVPYSPSDAITCDFDTAQSSIPEDIKSSAIEYNKIKDISINQGVSRPNPEANSKIVKLQEHNSTLQPPAEIQTKMNISIVSTGSSLTESSNRSLVNLDDLPETDIDEKSIATIITNSSNIYNHVTNSVSKKSMEEPLYMMGVSDITKDENKIPTLINRALVPALILKSNKHLQQPLLKEIKRKRELPQEPTFKNAEMQPVLIETGAVSKTTSTFKPIKLMTVVKKPISILTNKPVEFKNSLADESTNESANVEVAKTTVVASSVPHLINKDSTDKEQMEKSDDVSKSSLDSLDASLKYKKTKRNSRGKFKERKLREEHVSKNDSSSSSNADRHSPSLLKENRKSVRSREPLSYDRRSQESMEENNFNNREKECKSSSVSKIATDIASKDSLTVNSSHSSESQTKSDNIKCVKEGLTSEQTEAPNSADKQSAQTEKRRHSLDEDEDELRAKLLASLAKRSKLNDTESNSAVTINIEVPPTSVVSTNSPDTKLSQNISASASNMNQQESMLSSDSTAVTQQTSTSEAGVTEHKVSPLTQNTNVLKTENTAKSLEQLTAIATKKKSTTVIKSPLRKIAKKDSVVTSTKIVNNAKRTQSQKKLNLQSTTTLYTSQALSDNKPVCNVKMNENKWTANLRTLKLPVSQRLVINLNSDSESDSEIESKKQASNFGDTDKKPVSVLPVDFEKSIDQFLRDVRKKQESASGTSITSTGASSVTRKNVSNAVGDGKSSSDIHTPLAVRHLPASQQEEYRRLKLQIVEREKLKMQKIVNNITVTKSIPKKSVVSSKVQSNSQSVSSSSTPVTAKQNENILVKVSNEKARTLQLSNVKNIKSVEHIEKITENTPKSKISSKPITNLSIQIQNELVLKNSNVPRKIVDNTAKVVDGKQQTSVKKKSVYVVAPLPESKPTFGLQTLIKDSVNIKTSQVQEKQSISNHFTEAVTSSSKVTVNNSQLNKDKGFIDDTFQSVDMDIDERGNDFIINSTLIDSEASTVILPVDPEINNSVTNVDTTTESTLLLSSCSSSDPINLSNFEGVKDDCVNNIFDNNKGNKTNIKKVWETMRKDVEMELSSLINLPKEEQQRYLTETEQTLVMKRYTVLDDLADMSGTLRQWNMERDLQTSLVAEVNKLREQLRIAEEKLQEQRNRINSMGPKVVVAHGKIHDGRKECYRLSRICFGLGLQIVGKNYKVPEAGAQLLNNRFKEVTIHIRQLSKKKVPAIHSPDSSSATSPQKTLSNNKKVVELMQLDDNAKVEIAENFKVHAGTGDSEIVESPDSLNPLNFDISAISLNSSQEKNETVDAISCKVNVEPVTGNSTVKSVDEVVSVPDEVVVESTVINESLAKNSSTSTWDVNEDENFIRPSTSALTSNSATELNKCDKSINQLNKIFKPYTSILVHMKKERNLNPNGILCPYELSGTCSDGDCQFVHHSKDLI